MVRKHRAKRLKAAMKAGKQEPTKATFSMEPKRTGLLVTAEFTKAVEECKKRVEAIAKDCRVKNRRFRDIEFDLELDRNRCLHGLGVPKFAPSDVQRVTQLFEKPSFFVDGADSNDIQQGGLGDCWFVSALATLSTSEGLIDKFCVARDEQVGVYGFIFFRDTTWVPIIIDDLLFTSIPKFEELLPGEKILYHNDKDLYNQSARKTGKSLYFARSGTHGETWVPLVEKAFAKLHGNYLALEGGEAGEAVEDLTGGVNTFIATKDILDRDRFWHEELLKANIDRLFGCAFNALDSTRSGGGMLTVNGLIGAHAYSVLRAVEYNGKRFVVIRNPWGMSEWTGRWSDGSREWTEEWLPALRAIGHTFGDDGQFVMEYNDFIENWEQIDRCKLFDDSWIMSSQWLDVTARPAHMAWSYGDVSFTIKVDAGTPAIIVLSQADTRYYKPLDSEYLWTFDFVVFKKGNTDPLCYSAYTRNFSRSVNAELAMEAGEYVVHVRLDRVKTGADTTSALDNCQPRYSSRVLTERAKTATLSSNTKKAEYADYLPIPLSTLAGQDLSELEEKAKAAAEAVQKEKQALLGTEESGEEVEEKKDKKKKQTYGSKATLQRKEKTVEADGEEVEKSVECGDGDDESCETDEEGKVRRNYVEESVGNPEDVISEFGGEVAPLEDADDGGEDSDEQITLGLRVYTQREVPATIGGQLRHEMQVSFDGLAITAASDA